MLDLNELKEAVDSGQVDRNRVTVVMRNGVIVDFLTIHDQPRENEVVRTMSITEVLEEVFRPNSAPKG